MTRTSGTLVLVALIGSLAMAAPAWAQAPDDAAAMARKLQNPLANIKAVMTDNAIGFDTGNDGGTSYGWQLQPVYAIDFPDAGFTFLPRAIIPIMGLQPGTDVPPVGEPTPPGSGSVWGLGDMFVQTFFAPHTDGKVKYGFGPQFSLKTNTSSSLGGPDWGGGVVGIIVTDLTPSISFAGIVGNSWSFNGNFNSAIIQPMLFYNFASAPGMYVAYTAVISADWKASSDNRWTVPLGLSFGRTFSVGGGNGLDLMVGPYYNVARPRGGARWQVRYMVSWIFP